MKKKTNLFEIILFTVIFTGMLILNNGIKVSYAGSVQFVTPQVLIILDNSQSMDGDLSGAIMTGSGTVTNDQSSSSPLDYNVPAGFTAPVTGATSGSAPYTVSQSGVLIDNSASRLNVAKAAIMAAYNEWSSDVQFGLMYYGVQGTPSVYTTWVYYMSGANGFEFGSSATAPTGLQSVPNPCYLQTYTACNNSNYGIKSLYSGGVSYSDPYLYIQDTSDEPDINDVLYAGNLPSNFVTYESNQSSTYPYPDPVTPYPPNYSLTDYNNGNIFETYNEGTGNVGAFKTGPTNAGYVPYSPQVWFSQRGFGYYNNVTNKGDLLISIAAWSSSQQSAFSSAFAPETNKQSTSEIKADAINAPMAGTLASALSYLTGQGDFPPLPTTTCPAKKYVIFVTDGLPTYDQDGLNWPPIGSAAAAGYSVTATFNSDGSLATTNDNALSETIQEIGNLEAQGIKTYVVGLGAGVDPSLNPQAAAVLQAMAIAGGTDNYFPAITPAAVASDIGIIVQNIVSSGSYTTPVINKTEGSNNSLYYSNFIALNQTLWGEGNIFLFRLNSQGQLVGPSGPAVNSNGQISTSNSYWDNGNGAGGELQAENSGSRYLITSNIDSSTGLISTIPFDTANDLNLESLLGLTSANYKSVCGSSTTFERACADDIINFVLDPSVASNNWKLGALYHSNSVLIGQPPYPYSSSSYQAFKIQYATRQQVLVAGANDGMLHGFNAADSWNSSNNSYTCLTGTCGSEMFGYIPPDFLGTAEVCPSNPNLTLPKITCWYELSLASPSTNFSSYYSDFEFVDSTPSINDVFFGNVFNEWVDSSGTVNGNSSGTVNSVDSSTYTLNQSSLKDSWHTVLVGGERDGGKSYYALDLTNPANAGSAYPAPLWDFSDASASSDPMGATWSQPLISFVCLPNPNYVSKNGGTGICGNNPNPASPLVAPQYVETYAAFIGGGYSSNNSAGQAVYALYVEPNPVDTAATPPPHNYVDEQELWKFDGANDSNMKYSIPSAISPVTSGNFMLQAFYVGDLGGQMWALNIPFGVSPQGNGNGHGHGNGNNSNWTGCRIFASNQTTYPLNIFFQPAISYDSSNNLWLFFGTGNRENLSEVINARDNEFIGINTVGAQGIGECANGGAYNETDLTNETGTSGIGAVPAGSDGWYVTLSSGEKVVGMPLVYDNVIYFDTFTPSAASNACGNGTAKLYAVYYLNGGGTITTSGTTVTISNTITGGGASQSTTIGTGVPSAPVISNGNLIVTTSSGAVLTQKIPSRASALLPTSWFQLP